MKFDVFVRIEHGYTEATTSERFAFMYENFERLDRVIESNKSIFIIMLQSSMMRANWEGYVEKYNWEHKDESIARIEKYIDKAYARKKEKNLTKLFEYAKMLRVEKLMRSYMEVV